MITAVLTSEQYAVEKAICDKATAFWKANATYNRGMSSSLSAGLAAHPDYAACDNAMRGRVEQYELLRDLPEAFLAYLSEVDGRLRVTVWTGLPLGYATRGPSWRVDSAYGTHMSQYHAVINGREYTGRGFGQGMSIRLRETAESKRRRA